MKIQSYFSENKTFQRVRLRQNTAHPVLRHSRDMLASLRWLVIDLIYWSGFQSNEESNTRLLFFFFIYFFFNSISLLRRTLQREMLVYLQ